MSWRAISRRRSHRSVEPIRQHDDDRRSLEAAARARAAVEYALGQARDDLEAARAQLTEMESAAADEAQLAVIAEATVIYQDAEREQPLPDALNLKGITVNVRRTHLREHARIECPWRRSDLHTECVGFEDRAIGFVIRDSERDITGSRLARDFADKLEADRRITDGESRKRKAIDFDCGRWWHGDCQKGTELGDTSFKRSQAFLNAALGECVWKERYEKDYGQFVHGRIVEISRSPHVLSVGGAR